MQTVDVKQQLIGNTIQFLSGLPEEKVAEVADFAEFIFHKHEEQILSKGIERLVSESKSYDFLKEEEDLYTVHDVKERYR